MLFYKTTAILSIVLLVILLFYEFRRDLMMFQQNSYRPERYLKWLRQSGDSTSYTRLIAIFLFLFSLAGFNIARVAMAGIAVFAIFAEVLLARKKYKKPLVMTHRAKRIFVMQWGLTAVIVAAALTLSSFGLLGRTEPCYAAAITLLAVYCFSHGILLAANAVLSPVERRINRRFYNSAKEKLASVPDLTIIGITGSYGKTSTKHYLYRILSEHTETLMTPGSYNTTLGVVRTINEHLKPYHRIFIVEMGAKQKGDIKEICDLVHPGIGIITAVGPQHLETFHTEENVRDTKFELVDSLPSDGTAVLNNDYSLIAAREVTGCNVIRYSCKADDKTADYVASHIEYHPDGTTFILSTPENGDIRFETSLLGEYNIANLTGAIAVALLIGVPVDTIRYSVSRITAVEHRLSIRRPGNGLTILDDAFNSNPAGASMAVKVLGGMKSGRRIIITPGMIELGDRQYELNSRFGRQIAEAGIDCIAIVGNYNRDAITEGLTSGGISTDDILFFDTFLEANAWMVAYARPGDVVLIENDLPDTFK